MPTGPEGEHEHTTTALDDAIAALEARVKALEDAPEPEPPPPPPPDPEPVPPPSTVPAFLSRPQAAGSWATAQNFISLTGATDYAISGKSFKGIGPGKRAIVLTNPRGTVTVKDCDFDEAGIALYVVGAVGVTFDISGNRAKIVGPVKDAAGNRIHNCGNFSQFYQCSDVKGVIARNRIKASLTEDIISLVAVKANASMLWVEDNNLDNGAWTSNSGSGIALGDVAGTNCGARRNTLLNPGQVGIFIAGGTGHKILDNVIYGEQRPSSNVGLYVWKQGTTGSCSGHEVARNKVFWRNATGAPNAHWNGGNCGPIAGWDTNDWAGTSINPAALRVNL